MQPNAPLTRDRVNFVMLATSKDEAAEFLDAAINRRSHPQIHVVTSVEELGKIAPLTQNKMIPWYYLQGTAHNKEHREAYYHLEQRLGPVWSGPAFVLSMAEHIR